MGGPAKPGSGMDDVPLFGGQGTLPGVNVSSVPAGPSPLQQLGQGALGGIFANFGRQNNQPPAAGGMLGPGPAATPVDPSYFLPTTGAGRSPLYG